jgi:hypothetical protein
MRFPSSEEKAPEDDEDGGRIFVTQAAVLKLILL